MLCARAGVEIRLNTTVTPQYAVAQKADVLIAALGARPVKPPVEGIDGTNVYAAEEVYLDASKAGQKVVTMTLVTRVTVVMPYAAYGRVERLVADCRGKVRDTIFSEDVQLTANFRTGDEQAFVAAMRELANGDDLCTVGEPRFAEF